MPAATPLQRYQIMESLGEGRQGRTFRAVDRDTGREVAIKVLSLRELQGWKGFDRFEREIAMLASLDHRGIPRFIDSYASEATGDYFLVMELIEGVSLEAHVGGKRRLEAAALSSIFNQALDVLAYLHGHAPPIIHRDIKPANLMWTTTGRLVLVDFGGVIRPQDGNASTMIGTFGYMAPEQLHGEVSPAADIYALGATMAALATGAAAEALPRDGLRIRVEALDLPSPLRQVLPRMLAPEPNQRFRSVAAVREAAATASPPRPSSAVSDPRHAVSHPVVQSKALERLPAPLSVLVWILTGLGAGLLLVFEVVMLPLLARIARAAEGAQPQPGGTSEDIARLKDSVRRGREFLGEIANENRPRPDASSDDR